MEATRAEVLAHRAAVQGLHGGASPADLEVLALGFVDSPPKTGGAGLAVRVGPYFDGSGMGDGSDRPAVSGPRPAGPRPDGPGTDELRAGGLRVSGLWGGGPGFDRSDLGGRPFETSGLDGPRSEKRDLGGPPFDRRALDGLPFDDSDLGGPLSESPPLGRLNGTGPQGDGPEFGRPGPNGPAVGRSGFGGLVAGGPGLGGSEFGRPGSGGLAVGRSGFGGLVAGAPGLGGSAVGRSGSGGLEFGRSGIGGPAAGGSGLGESEFGESGLGRSGLGEAVGGRLKAGLPGLGGQERDRLVRVLSLRGAPHLHRAADLPVLRRELRPRTPKQVAAWVGGFAVPDPDQLDVLVEALHREFPGERATKGELSAAVGPHLPAGWTPWCEPCGANHVVDGLFRLGTLLAGLELEHVGARLVFRKPSGPVPAVEPEGEPTLLRAYARLVGPFAKADAEKWLGAGPPSAWPEGLRPVVVEGKRLLALEDVAQAPPPPAGLLLFPRDPYLLGPRWLVAPDAAVAKRVWRAVGSPGALVVRGEVVGDWRYTFSGRTVTFHVRGWKRIKGEARRSVHDQAALLAAVWGGSALEPDVVEWASA